MSLPRSRQASVSYLWQTSKQFAAESTAKVCDLYKEYQQLKNKYKWLLCGAESTPSIKIDVDKFKSKSQHLFDIYYKRIVAVKDGIVNYKCQKCNNRDQSFLDNPKGPRNRFTCGINHCETGRTNKTLLRKERKRYHCIIEFKLKKTGAKICLFTKKMTRINRSLTMTSHRSNAKEQVTRIGCNCNQ